MQVHVEYATGRGAVDVTADDAELVQSLRSRWRHGHVCSGTVELDLAELTSDQLVNAIALFHKSWKMLAMVSGTHLSLAVDGRARRVHAWSRARSVPNYKDDRPALVEALANYCHERMPGFALGSDSKLKISLIDQSISRDQALAFTQRCINAIAWVKAWNTRLSGKSFLTWASFELVTKEISPIVTRGSAVVNTNHGPTATARR